MGWRGYLLDRFESKWSPEAATLGVALAWWSWHLPLFLLPGYFDPFGGPPMGPLGYLWDILPVAVLFTWIYNNTRRSVLAVTALHFVGNLSGELMGLSSESRSWHLILRSVVALAILVGWRRKGHHLTG